MRTGRQTTADLKRHIIRSGQKPRDNLFSIGLLKSDLKLVALDPHNRTIAELLVEHPLSHGEATGRGHVDGHILGLGGLAHPARPAARLQAPPTG